MKSLETSIVAIFLFDEVEVPDFAGPFELFSTASRLRTRTSSTAPFRVVTVANETRSVQARGGLNVVSDFALDEHPSPDILILPGGDVTTELRDERVVRWIARTARSAKLTAAVCTGALLLAAAGVLEKKRATTHWDFRSSFPTVRVESGPRWIDEGDVATSAGISAGLDVSLHLVRRLAGAELARATARQMDCRSLESPE